MSFIALALVLCGLAALAAWLVAWPVLAGWLLVRRFVERSSLARWTPVAMFAPLVVVAGLFTSAIAYPAVEAAVRQECHCLPGSVHLCVRHPELAVPLMPLAALGWLLIPGFVTALRAAVRRLDAERRLAACARASAERPRLLLADLAQPNAFATTSGAIVADEAWWRSLEPAERQIVLAHEQAHLSRRDPWLLHALMVARSCCPQGVGRACLRDWRGWAEQRADARAASQVGDHVAVAEFLVRQHRPRGEAGACPLPGPALHGGSSLERRVHDLLSGVGTKDADPGSPDIDGRGLMLLSILMTLPLCDRSALHAGIEALGQVFHG